MCSWVVDSVNFRKCRRNVLSLLLRILEWRKSTLLFRVHGAFLFFLLPAGGPLRPHLEPRLFVLNLPHTPAPPLSSLGWLLPYLSSPSPTCPRLAGYVHTSGLTLATPGNLCWLSPPPLMPGWVVPPPQGHADGKAHRALPGTPVCHWECHEMEKALRACPLGSRKAHSDKPLGR